MKRTGLVLFLFLLIVRGSLWAEDDLDKMIGISLADTANFVIKDTLTTSWQGDAKGYYQLTDNVEAILKKMNKWNKSNFKVTSRENDGRGGSILKRKKLG